MPLIQSKLTLSHRTEVNAPLIGAEIEAELIKVARELATASHSRLNRTSDEVAELEEQLRQLKARRDGQLDAQARFGTYRPKVGKTDFKCPNCWIVDGQQSILNAIPCERPEEDIMRCPTCGHDFGISLRDEAITSREAGLTSSCSSRPEC